MAAERQRLDVALTARNLAPSRERAQAIVLAGRVLVNEQKITKPGAQIAPDAAIRILGEDMPYVSRGGIKLEAALRHWDLNMNGRDCLDIGTSTGGFTDCLLQHGARSVLAVDTGYGQIAHKLRADARITLMERTNARLLQPGELPQDITMLVMDVSFISATLVLPAVLAAAGWRAFDGSAAVSRDAVVLIKPQFEAGREAIGKGGIVRDEADRQFAVERVRTCVEECGGAGIDVIPSPITGAEGNVEFLLNAQFS